MTAVSIAVESPRGPGIAELLRDGETYAESLYPAEENFILPLSALEKPGVTVFVARVDGRALGMAALVLAGSGAELKRLYVAEAARGQGLGKAVIDFVVAEARTQGFKAVRLEVERHNARARRVYAAAGFAAHDRDLLTLPL